MPMDKLTSERFELALQGSKTYVLDWDIPNNFLYISENWKRMLGYSENELSNSVKTWKQIAHTEDRKRVIIQLIAHERSKHTYFECTHRLKHKKGHWVWVMARANIMYDEEGNKVRMVGTHTDITEEKKSHLKHFYQSQMIEQINDSVTTTDLKGNIVSWNAGSEKTFGYTAKEVIGKNIAILYQDKDRVELPKHIKNLMRTGTYNADFDLVRKDKVLVPISFSLSMMRDENAKPIGVVGINKDNSKRKEAEKALLEQKEILHYQAHHDLLTRLPNRILFTKRLDNEILNAKLNHTHFALFFIDLDKFKKINDSLGHSIGDHVLKIIAKRLKKIIRKDDTLARLSGDEFTIIMSGLSSREDASQLAEKILETIEDAIHINGNILYVSGSIGISLYPEHASLAEDLLKYADTAMYNVKEEGRNTYMFYTFKMTEDALEHISMKSALKQALVNEEFFIQYQPQLDIAKKTLVGIEALIRWNHPSKGLLDPIEFIPLAEETGLIVEIDRWMMNKAMDQVGSWQKEGLEPGTLAINLSIKQLDGDDCLEEFRGMIKRHKFKPESIVLEITESQMMKKPEDTICKLREISSLGVNIAIDDFGTGYSSLSLLKRLPITKLKIDKSFIADIPNSSDDIAIVQAIIALGKSLKLDLIAEGVENIEQEDFLRENGCTQMQGYYYSYPLSAKELKEKFLLNTDSKAL